MDSASKRIIRCQSCNQRLRIPLAVGEIWVTCPKCRSRWLMNTGQRRPYQILDIVQGTEEWHEWRDQGIGASDAPTVMGENRWKSRQQLLYEKRSRIREPTNEAMRRGAALEPEARKCYQQVTGTIVRPVCLQSTAFDWLRASVDGISTDGCSVVEIKCGERAYERTASSRRVPGYYVGQLQHILAVTGLAEINFWCYLPRHPEVHLLVKRDKLYIERLLRTEEQFWKELRMGK